MSSTSRIPAVLAAALILALALLAGACGRKGPPSPQTGEDTFTFGNSTGTQREGCITVRTQISGNRAMLDSVSLLLEDMTLACPTCPFRPQGRVDFALDDDRVRIRGDVIQVTWCELSGGREYRFRLSGNNRLSTLPPSLTPVFPVLKNSRLDQE